MLFRHMYILFIYYLDICITYLIYYLDLLIQYLGPTRTTHVFHHLSTVFKHQYELSNVKVNCPTSMLYHQSRNRRLRMPRIDPSRQVSMT